MSKPTLIILITAGALIVAGLIICFVAFFASGKAWNVFTANSTAKLNTERKTAEFTEEITSLDVNLVAEDIEFRKSDDSSFRVDYNENEKLTHDIKVEDGVLKIVAHQEGLNLNFNVGLNINTEPDVVVYIPEGTVLYSAILDIDTGDVSAKTDFDSVKLDVKISTGDVSLEGTSVKEAMIDITTGDLDLKGYKDISSLTVDITTGDIKISDVTADTVKITAVTGDLSADRFEASDIDVKITTGDVDCDLINENDYDYDLDTITGDVDYPGHNQDASRIFKIDLGTGDIEIA